MVAQRYERLEWYASTQSLFFDSLQPGFVGFYGAVINPPMDLETVDPVRQSLLSIPTLASCFCQTSYWRARQRHLFSFEVQRLGLERPYHTSFAI